MTVLPRLARGILVLAAPWVAGAAAPAAADPVRAMRCDMAPMPCLADTGRCAPEAVVRLIPAAPGASAGATPGTAPALPHRVVLSDITGARIAEATVRGVTADPPAFDLGSPDGDTGTLTLRPDGAAALTLQRWGRNEHYALEGPCRGE